MNARTVILGDGNASRTSLIIEDVQTRPWIIELRSSIIYQSPEWMLTS